MATLIILIGLMPSLLCELPKIPIEVSKETTFITEPLAGDGLPNYALAVQELQGKGIISEQNGAIPFWQAMGQCVMSDEEFERLTLEISLPANKKVIPLIQLHDKATLEAVIVWLRETRRNSNDMELAKLADEYVNWVQRNPWTSKDVPPLAEWLAENEQAIELLVEASQRPQFSSPYPHLLVDRTVYLMELLTHHAEGIRVAARILMARAMNHIEEDDLVGAWRDCRATIALGNHLASYPFLVEQLVAVETRNKGLWGTCVILSQANLSLELARQILDDLRKLDRRIDFATALNHGERMMAIDYMLRMTTERLGGMPDEEKNGVVLRIVEAGVDLNISLRWINQRYDRIVQVSRIKDRKERVEQLGKLVEESKEETEKMRSLALLGRYSQTFRSNVVGAILFIFTCPDLKMECNRADQDAQDSVLVKVAAALAVYKTEQGHYPRVLDELSPSILNEIPNDFYSDKPLQYRRMKEGYLLYSLFENGIDDGATDVGGEIRQGEWHADKEEIDREKCDLVIRIPVPNQPIP